MTENLRLLVSALESFSGSCGAWHDSVPLAVQLSNARAALDCWRTINDLCRATHDHVPHDLQQRAFQAQQAAEKLWLDVLDLRRAELARNGSLAPLHSEAWR